MKRDLFSQKELEDWAETVIANWIYKMLMLGMLEPGNSGELVRSLDYHIKWEARGADRVEYLQRVQFVFLAYGKFVDYGLGRGTDLQSRFERGTDERRNPRRRKRWILKPWMEALQLISPLISGYMAFQLTKRIARGFTDEDGEYNTNFTA